MVNSSRAAAAHSWAACSRPGDTWRGELARHASQNEKLESSSTGRNAAGPRLPRRTGGIAQLVERRLCKPNVAGPSPTASTNAPPRRRATKGRRSRGGMKGRGVRRAMKGRLGGMKTSLRREATPRHCGRGPPLHCGQRPPVILHSRPRPRRACSSVG